MNVRAMAVRACLVLIGTCGGAALADPAACGLIYGPGGAQDRPSPDGAFQPFGSDIHPGSDANGVLAGILTNRLKGSFDGVIAFEVFNQGDEAATFTASLEPGSHSAYIPTGQSTGIPIGPREMAETGPVATISASLPSGSYRATVCVHNDLNPMDSDESVFYEFWVYDPPSLSDNSGLPVDPAVDPGLWIANAPAGPHEGALRAGVEVTATALAGSGFSVSGISIGDRAGPDQAIHGAAAFDVTGRTARLHRGSFTVELRMVSMNDPYLNGARPVPPITWELVRTVEARPSQTAQVRAGQAFRDAGLGVRNATTAADIVGGVSSVDRSASLELDPAGDGGPGFAVTADILGSAVGIDLGGGGDAYVLQVNVEGIAGDPAALEALRLLVYDAPADLWRNAIELNGNFAPEQLLAADVGGRFHARMTFADYLSAGGLIEAGHHGVHISGSNPCTVSAWAILDHDSIFGAGIVPEPACLSLLAAGALAVLRPRRRG